MKKLIYWFMQTSFYHWLVINVIPYIRFTTYYTSLRGWKFHRGYQHLRPGDIILTVDRKKLTTLLIPGDIAHAALCVGKGEEWEISEMTHLNYTKSHFFDICKESDRVIIARCTDWDPEYIEKVIEKCKSFKDATYDIEFEFDVKALYCSELVYQSDFERRLDVDLDDVVGIGRKYISPTGLYEAKNLEIVWDSDQEQKDETI